MGEATICPICGDQETVVEVAKKPKNIFSLLGLIFGLLGFGVPIATVLGILGLCFADSKYEGEGKKMGIWAIVLSVVMPWVWAVVGIIVYLVCVFILGLIVGFTGA